MGLNWIVGVLSTPRWHRDVVRGAALLCAFGLAGCSCDGTTNPGDQDAATGDSSLDGGAMDGGVTLDGSGADGGGDSDVFDSGNPCDFASCGPGERCEVLAGIGTCVPNTCAELSCGPTERCDPAPVGLGNVCTDISCDDDLDCPESEYCDGTVCVADVCSPGTQRCVSGGVSQCADNGGSSSVLYTCGSDAYFTSVCVDDSTSSAFCSCEDDWDCPEFTVCEAGACEGTGRAPTCFLPPADFSSVLPTPEPGFPWGGTYENRNATGSPFAKFAQVVVTPVVANLDDDNGDGLVDERDFPEIIFLGFRDSAFTTDGVLRAVHGGGPDRGEDFFAVCNDTVWREGDNVSLACGNGEPDLDPTAGIAVGDLTGDGVPEIVAIGERVTIDSVRYEQVRIYEADGTPLLKLPQFQEQRQNPSPSIANIDGSGLPELIYGYRVFTFQLNPMGDLEFVDSFVGNLGQGHQGQGPISCVGDLDNDGNLEIAGGSTVYRLPTAPAGVTRQSECSGSETDPEEVRFCAGELTVVWDGVNDNPPGSGALREGFCAIADVLGANRSIPTRANNPPDGVPELVLIANGRLQIYDGQDGTILLDQGIGAGSRGGAPNVDDFDGDGYPEVGSAFESSYVLMDLQPPTGRCPDWPNVFDDDMTGLQGNPARTPPGRSCNQDSDCGNQNQFACNEATNECVCLHNGWRRETEDDSSRVTGSSVFDFNGDGAAEVIYNDECYFRVYEGLDGTVLFKEFSESRTRTENPVVADVDNDGNAEIVFAASNESKFCSEFAGNDDVGRTVFNNGLEVWGDASDFWVSARRIYNQHAYHVTNVTEGGSIPLREPESWGVYGGRSYNTYRSQPRQPFGIAPDLLVDGVQVSSPDTSCGTLSTNLNLSVRIRNAGDLRVGPGVVIGFHGLWNAGPTTEPLFADNSGTPLTATLSTSIDPGGTTTITLPYDATLNTIGTVPDQLRVVADETDAARECNEANNELLEPVDPGDQAADLTVELGMVAGTCPEKTFQTTLRNLGSLPVSGALLRFYAGDPQAGGDPIGDFMVTETIAPGGFVTVTASVNPFPGRSVVVYVVVDPDNTIEECNDGNNMDNTSDRYSCLILI